MNFAASECPSHIHVNINPTALVRVEGLHALTERHAEPANTYNYVLPYGKVTVGPSLPHSQIKYPFTTQSIIKLTKISLSTVYQLVFQDEVLC